MVSGAALAKRSQLREDSRMRPLVGLRWAGPQWNPSNLTVPRIRLYPADERLLVFVGVADGNCDAVAGIDLYVTGWLGERLSGWLWERGRLRQERTRR